MFRTTVGVFSVTLRIDTQNSCIVGR